MQNEKQLLIERILTEKLQGGRTGRSSKLGKLSGGPKPTHTYACQGGGGNCNHVCTGDSPCNGDQTCDCQISMCGQPDDCKEIYV
jgi:hypothetical protein